MNGIDGSNYPVIYSVDSWVALLINSALAGWFGTNSLLTALLTSPLALISNGFHTLCNNMTWGQNFKFERACIDSGYAKLIQ